MDPWAAYYAAQAQAQAGQQQMAPQAKQPTPGGVPASFAKLSGAAQAKLSGLYQSMMLQTTDLEDCVFDSLADFTEAEQSTMCDSFCSANLVTVRNKTAFMIGILKRHRASGGQ
jgi:ABC-type branched-subunit amino acid transport system permease subunit